ELFLHRLKRLSGMSRRSQQYWVNRGEPSDRSRGIHVIENIFATVSFKIDEKHLVLRPVAHRQSESCEQRILDLRVVDRWYIAQKSMRLLLTQRHHDGTLRANQIGRPGVIHRQWSNCSVSQSQPNWKFFLKRLGTGMIP